MKFAEGTSVPVAKTRGEIEALVGKYGADEFASGWQGNVASIQFRAHGRRVRFTIDMPDLEWGRDAIFRRKRSGYWNRANVPEAKARDVADAEDRRRWRCLLLAIKAKLEVVESGIATFDEEFLAHIVMEDGATIYERITAAAVNGRPLLPPVGGGA